MKAMQPGAPALHAQLRRQTRGLAFYATPHHGSWLADVGWNLRFLGASPAASVVHLKRGPPARGICCPHRVVNTDAHDKLQSEQEIRGQECAALKEPHTLCRLSYVLVQLVLAHSALLLPCTSSMGDQKSH